MKKYEIVVCNLGYENSFLSYLNEKAFYNPENALEEIITELPDGFQTVKIDGFQVKKIHDDINFNEEGISPVVETIIPDRWIYIREI
jgi:predicted nuclease of restriction endonuclease-like (RecB) superfamily